MTPYRTTGPIAPLHQRFRALGRSVSDAVSTIRGRILFAFLTMSLITGALGLYAIAGIQQVGDLVHRTYDESLMSINYARATAADFAKMRSAFARRVESRNAAVIAKLDQEIADLVVTLAEDLTVAVERSQSIRARRAAEAVQAGVTAWDEMRRSFHPEQSEVHSDAWDNLDHQAAVIDGQIDLLVNYTAGDGFAFRQSARTVVSDQITFTALSVGAAMVLAGIVAWLLHRRIIGPLSAASAVAQRIAAGRLDDAIPTGRRDELGRLLTAMATMRDNIRAMMEREVSQRRSAEALLADALQSSREGIVVVDAQGRIVVANAQAAQFFGGLGAEVEAGTAMMPAPGEAPTTEYAAVLAETGKHHLSDGRWLRVSRSPIQGGGFVAVCSDVTQLMEQDQRLTETNRRLDAALDNMSQGLCLYDANHRLMVVNRRYGEIYGLPPGAVAPGMTALQVLARNIETGTMRGRRLEDLVRETRDAFGQGFEHTLFQTTETGRIIAIMGRATGDGGFVATYEDVTERRQAEERIAFLAHHDVLTGLPNRLKFAEQIEGAIAQAGRDNGFALLSIDIDGFRPINDTLGRVVGDEVLQAVANRLSACVREVDCVARLGADEFAVIQRGVERAEDVAVLAKRIGEVISAPYTLSSHRVTLGVSIGIALAPGDGMSGERLMKSADMALDRAKSEARGGFRFFEPEMDARIQAKRLLERDLRDALAAGAFNVHYQPIYDLAAERVCGFEALVRWFHPVRGPVSPAEFIPLAEEIGLIVPLGEWVLRRACEEASRWPADLKIAVNVSAVQFTSASLVTAVRETLRATGLPGRRLELEITESVLVGNPGATTAILHSLKGLGVRVSMDDFGTGYSSLSYLRSFPFDKIKIDQSFVRHLGEPDGTDFIVRAVIGLGGSLGMTVTAEGVETEAQLARLRAEGCDEVQGYLFSRPVPASDVAAVLQRWNGAAQAIA